MRVNASQEGLHTPCVVRSRTILGLRTGAKFLALFLRGMSGEVPPACAAVEVSPSDVIRLVLQFLREQGLQRSLAALASESGVPLNAVPDGSALQDDVLAGRWEAVLAALAGASLPIPLQAALFEQIFLELVEARALDAARALLRGSGPLIALRRADAPRVARLEALAARPAWDAAAAYGSAGAGGRVLARTALARALASHVVAVPPGRLVALLGQALRWQAASGSLLPSPAAVTGSSSVPLRYDIFRGALPLRRDIEERPCALPIEEAAAGGGGLAPLSFGAAAHPTAADFTPDGGRLIVGCVDGIIECYDAEAGSGALCSDLEYQSRDEFMLHDDAVLCLAVAKPAGDLLASGSRDGAVKVWRLTTGEAVVKFASPHGAGAGVTALAFSRDCASLLTGGFDGVVKLHGLRSGQTLKAYTGHTDAITSLAVTVDGSYVSASADGTARVWQSRGTECIAVLRPPPTPGAASALGATPLIAALPLPSGAGDLVVVAPRAGAAFLMTLRGGAVVRTFSLPAAAKPGGRAPTLAAVAVSPQGRFFYAATDDGALHVFAVRTGALEASLTPRAAPEAGAGWAGEHQPARVGVGSALGLVHHPLRNQLAAFASDGNLRVVVPDEARA